MLGGSTTADLVTEHLKAETSWVAMRDGTCNRGKAERLRPANCPRPCGWEVDGGDDDDDGGDGDDDDDDGGDGVGGDDDDNVADE